MNTFRLKTEGFELELSGERDFVEGQLKRLFGDSATAGFEKVRDDFRPTSIPFEEFLKLKDPKNPLENLITLAYYLEKYERLGTYTQRELQDRQGELWDPQVLQDALAEGLLDAPDEDAFTLTFSGEQYVQGGF